LVTLAAEFHREAQDLSRQSGRFFNSQFSILNSSFNIETDRLLALESAFTVNDNRRRTGLFFVFRV
jgi:hypothetical protein